VEDVVQRWVVQLQPLDGEAGLLQRAGHLRHPGGSTPKPYRDVLVGVGDRVPELSELHLCGLSVRRGQRDSKRRLTDLGLQLTRGAFRHDASTVDDGDARAELVGFLHVLRGQEDRRPGCVQLSYLLPQRGAGVGIEARGGLVEEHHLGLVHQGEGQVEPSLHPSRVRGHTPVRCPGQADRVKKPRRPLSTFGGIDPVQDGLEMEQLASAHQRVERRLLEGHADRSPNRVGLGGHVVARHPGSSRGRLQQGGEHAHRGRLPGAVGPEEPEDLAAPDPEIDAVHGDDVAEAPGQPLGHDGVGPTGLASFTGEGIHRLGGGSHGFVPATSPGCRVFRVPSRETDESPKL
jgi:hypothetical protein